MYGQLLRQVRKRVGYSALRAIDTTTEAVSKVLFSLWKYDKNRGAVRIGVEYDPYYELPEKIIITDGKTADPTHGKRFRFKKGITYLLDRGFWDYTLYAKIIKRAAFFIARVQKRTVYTLLATYALTEADVISDEIVILGNKKDKYEIKTHPVRIIKCLDDKKENIIWFVTNRFDLSTKEIRELYRRRWDIEVFFKFLKQNLKLKKFFGTSKNAIKIQIYCALIAYLLVYLVKPKLERMTRYLRKVRYALFSEQYQVSFYDSS